MVKKKKTMKKLSFLFLAYLPQVPLMGPILCFNGSLKYDASFKYFPLEDFLLDCFINFPEINN